MEAYPSTIGDQRRRIECGQGTYVFPLQHSPPVQGSFSVHLPFSALRQISVTVFGVIGGGSTCAFPMRAGLGNVLPPSRRVAWTAHSPNETVQNNMDQKSSLKDAFMARGLEVNLLDSD